jgi:hypothetical protein
MRYHAAFRIQRLDPIFGAAVVDLKSAIARGNARLLVPGAAAIWLPVEVFHDLLLN